MGLLNRRIADQIHSESEIADRSNGVRHQEEQTHMIRQETQPRNELSLLKLFIVVNILMILAFLNTPNPAY